MTNHPKESTVYTLSEQPDVEAVALFDLPALKQRFKGGVFCGVTTLPDGKHAAIVKLVDEPAKRLLNWKQATAWAKSVHGQLPTPAIAAQLSFLADGLIARALYWTCEPQNEHYTFLFDFKGCCLDSCNPHGDANAFAIRLIPLAEPVEAYELERRVQAIEARVATAELADRVAALESRLPGGT